MVDKGLSLDCTHFLGSVQGGLVQSLAFRVCSQSPSPPRGEGLWEQTLIKPAANKLKTCEKQIFSLTGDFLSLIISFSKGNWRIGSEARGTKSLTTTWGEPRFPMAGEHPNGDLVPTPSWNRESDYRSARAPPAGAHPARPCASPGPWTDRASYAALFEPRRSSEWLRSFSGNSLLRPNPNAGN